jgi:hypothetical protein
MGEMKNSHRILAGSPKGRDHLKALTLNYILET